MGSASYTKGAKRVGGNHEWVWYEPRMDTNGHEWEIQNHEWTRMGNSEPRMDTNGHEWKTQNHEIQEWNHETHEKHEKRQGG